MRNVLLASVTGTCVSVPRWASGCAATLFWSAAVGKTFHKSVAERAERDAKRLDCFSSRDVFDDVGISRSSMNQLPAGCINEIAIGDVTGPEFHLLAECSDVNRLVTFDAADVVIGWSKTVFDCFAFGEYELVVFEPAIAASGGRLRFVYAFVDRCALDAEAVEQVIGFGVHVGGQCFGCSLTFDRLGRAQG